MLRRKAGLWLVLAALVAALAACTVVVRHPPMPAPRVEIIPDRPHARAVWVRGHWEWRSRAGRWVWIPGRWRR